MSAVIAVSALLSACSPSSSASSAVEPAPVEEAAPEETASPPRSEPESAPPASSALDAAAWQLLLSTYVTDDGGFRYEALRVHEEHRAALASLVEGIAGGELDGLSRDARLAFFINAYNILVVHAVLERWPLESVMRSEGFFDGATYTVAGHQRTLNGLENDVIRGEEFAEPRIHFAVNCASAGCPPIATAPYSAENLEAQLGAQAVAFMRATTRIDRSRRRVQASQLFEWFAADFEPAGGARAFIAERLEAADGAFVRDPETRITYFEYDWALNARP